MSKLRKGQSHTFNNWLHVLIAAQGLTVAGVVAGSWTWLFNSHIRARDSSGTG